LRAELNPAEQGVEAPGTPCVLVVEDDALTQERLELLIEAVGMAAVSVPSTVKARAASAAVYFPILIVDRMLEDGDGIALCGELRRHYAPRPVYLIVLSALDAPADIARGVAAGADAYLSKRSTDGDFLEALDKARRTIAARG
jgi:DNA-binding response OmpR family regulator